jgi:hypothetical protein
VAERFLIRTEGGPCNGETRVANAGMEHLPSGQWEWPLPDALEYDGTGRYVKVAQSDLPPMEADSPVVRGATYRWEPADAS